MKNVLLLLKNIQWEQSFWAKGFLHRVSTRYTCTVYCILVAYKSNAMNLSFVKLSSSFCSIRRAAALPSGSVARPVPLGLALTFLRREPQCAQSVVWLRIPLALACEFNSLIGAWANSFSNTGYGKWPGVGMRIGHCRPTCKSNLCLSYIFKFIFQGCLEAGLKTVFDFSLVILVFNLDMLSRDKVLPLQYSPEMSMLNSKTLWHTRANRTLVVLEQFFSGHSTAFYTLLERSSGS